MSTQNELGVKVMANILKGLSHEMVLAFDDMYS
jgi:hypothetical protein